MKPISGVALLLIFASCRDPMMSPPGPTPDPDPLPDTSSIWEATSLPFTGTIQDILPVGNDTLFVGTWGGGIFRSADTGATWQRIATNPIDLDDVICLAQAADRAILIGTAVLNGFYRSIDGGESWTEVLSSPGIPEDLHTEPGGGVLAGVFYQGVLYSADNGLDWSLLSTAIDDRVLSVCFTAKGSFLTGTNSGLYRSTDQGAGWEMVLTGTGRFLATNTHQTLFVGKGMSVYRSWDDGATWSSGDTIGTVGPFASHENGTLFAGTDEGGVFVSTDEGTSWTPLTGGLPDDGIRSLAVMPGGIVFVGTYFNGLYRSTHAIAVE